MSAPTAASHPLPLRHCYWVVPGLLLAGEHPNGPTRDKTKDRLKKLLAAGIECFVDLTKPTELLRYDTHLPFYVEYTRKAIKDHSTPGSRAQMTEILDYIANSMRAGRPVYVHCHAGIGRTGTVVGCLLAERGLQGNAAIDELNRLWQQCRRSKSWAFIPETDAQASYIRDWTPTLESGGFELSSLATAVATVGPMTTASSVRPGVPDVSDAQARAGTRKTGAGQTHAAGENLAAGKVRGGARAGTSSVGYAPGAGLSAAAEHARAAVARGDVPKGAPMPSAGGGGARAGSAAVAARGDDLAKAASVPSLSGGGARAGSAALEAGGDGGARLGPAFLDARDELEKGEISPSIRAEVADAIAGRSSAGKGDIGAAAGPVARDAKKGVAGAATRDAGDGYAALGGGGGTAAPNSGEEAECAYTARGGTEQGAGGAADDRRGAGGASASGVGLAGGRSETSGPGAVHGRADSLGHGAADGRGDMAKPGVADERSDALRLDGPDGRRGDPLWPGPGGSRADGGSPSGATGRRARAGKPAAAPEAVAPQRPGSIARGPAVVRGPADLPMDLDPLLDADTLAAARGLRERFLGTLFGLAIGDAVAAPTQFRRPGSFSPIGDMIGGGPFDLPRGAWSDDTAMALCLAESLLERDGFDARDQVQRYSRWQQEGYMSSTGQCVGITANTARSLALAKWRRVVFPGSHDPEQLDPEPLSRIAPIALFYFASLETTLVQAADSSRTTCQAPAVLDACRRLGRALNAALSGQPKTMILTEAGPIHEGAAQLNNTAATALAAALWAFSSTDNYRDAVLRAANVGGNSDVVAAVCGQLAGAHYGATGIPQSWRSGLIQKDLIEAIADRLLAHGLVSLSG
jgi:ADP-ribosyl-[dinitrogen reductase] hydrolase